MGIQTWLGLLALWFSIDYLLGPKLMARLETAWLRRARSNALLLSQYWRYTRQVVLPMLAVSTPVWVGAILIAGFVSIGRSAVRNNAVNRGWGWFAAAFVVGAVYSGSAYALRKRLSVVFRDKGSLFRMGESLVLFPSLAIEWANESVEAQQLRPGRHYSNPYGIMIVLACGMIMVAGLLLVPLVLGQLLCHILITLFLGSAWLVMFMPSLALSAIAKRTGAESYFRVGKFFVALAAAALAVIRGLQ